MCLTDDPVLAERLRQLRNHGQSSPGIFARASGNYRLSEIAAAVGIAQLARLDTMIIAREALADRYAKALTELPIQQAPPGARRNHQTFGVLLPARLARDAVIAQLRDAGIETGRLSYALHALPQFMSAALSARSVGRSFPVATALAERGLALPLWPGLTDADQSKVIERLKSVLA
jgi:perosamine synthetase